MQKRRTKKPSADTTWPLYPLAPRGDKGHYTPTPADLAIVERFFFVTHKPNWLPLRTALVLKGHKPTDLSLCDSHTLLKLYEKERGGPMIKVGFEAAFKRFVDNPPARPLEATGRGGGKDAESGGTLAQASQEPVDLIPCAVAIKEFHVSRATLQRHRKDGTLEGYRLPTAAPNATFRYSRAVLKTLFVPKSPKTL